MNAHAMPRTCQHNEQSDLKRYCSSRMSAADVSTPQMVLSTLHLVDWQPLRTLVDQLLPLGHLANTIKPVARCPLTIISELTPRGTAGFLAETCDNRVLVRLLLLREKRPLFLGFAYESATGE
jgi:hypothetical protein